MLPVAIAVLGFLVLAGRLAGVNSDLASAARDAARAASLADTPEGAQQQATEAAQATLADQKVTCGRLNVAVDASRLQPGGEVSVTLTCTVSLADIAIPGVPGERTVSATSVEVIDRLRGTG
jgi:Flp pilus assembly protein TadG